MRRVYFTVCWNRGDPELDACLDISSVDPEDWKYLTVCKELKITTPRYRELEERAAGITRAMAGIDIRLRFNPQQEGPFIVSAAADILDREVLDTMIKSKHVLGELREFLDKAQVHSPAVFKQAK